MPDKLKLRPPAEAGPIGRLIGLLAGVILLIAGVMFSLVLLAVIAVAGLLAWSYFRWKTRKLRQARRDHPPGGLVIDGEVVVVDDDASRRDQA